MIRQFVEHDRLFVEDETTQAIGNCVDLRSFSADFFGWRDADLRVPNMFASAATYRTTQRTSRLAGLIQNAVGDAGSRMLMTDGAGMAFHYALLSLRGQIDYLLIPSPYFPPYKLLPVLLDMCTIEYSVMNPLRAKETISRTVERGRVAVVINSPHNPTGVEVCDEFAKWLCRSAPDMKMRLIWDRTYSWADHARQRKPPPDIRIYSIGKLVGLPALRLGAIVVDDNRTFNALNAVSRHIAHHCSPLAERLALWVLEEHDVLGKQSEWRLRLNARLRECRDSVTLGICGGGKQLLVGPYALARRRFKRRSAVAAVRGDVFGAGADFIRICIGVSESTWRRFVALGSASR